MFIDELSEIETATTRPVSDLFIQRLSEYPLAKASTTIREFFGSQVGAFGPNLRHFRGVLVELNDGSHGIFSSDDLFELIATERFSYNRTLGDCCRPLVTTAADQQLDPKALVPVGVTDGSGQLIGILDCCPSVILGQGGRTAVYVCG